MMSSQKPKDTEAAEGASETPANEPEAAPDPTPEPTPQAASDELTAQNAELKSQLLLALADQENLRKRVEKEKQDLRKFGISSFAGDLLSVADNLQRALDSVTDAMRGDADLKPFLEGVEMTRRELQQALERNGVKPVDPAGQPFDHNLHQAMMEVDDPNATPGTVVHVMQIGYTIHDRLLRPALVGVAKKRPGEKAAGGGDTMA